MGTKRILVYTENYPYGSGETFLESEALFLCKTFDEVVFIPLWGDGEQRILPSNAKITQPMLDFNPKGNAKLVMRGVFSKAPILFPIPEFFREKVYKSKARLWDFLTSMFLIRAVYPTMKKQIAPNDLVYFYWGNKSVLSFALLKLRGVVENVGVARFHGSDLYEYARSSGYFPFRRLLFSQIDVAVAISESGKKYLIDHYGDFAPKNVEVHRLGVFDNGWNPQKNNDSFHIVSCSSIVPVKRLELLAKAIGMLDFKVSWHHIGDGPNRASVEALMNVYSDNISATLLGIMPNSQVMEYYRNHHVDLFVNVSASEGVPVAVMEALSFGIPVLATNVGGTSEIVDDSVGKLIDSDISPEQLAKEITCFYENSSVVGSFKPRDRWKERCNADNNYKVFCERLMEIFKY